MSAIDSKLTDNSGTTIKVGNPPTGGSGDDRMSLSFKDRISLLEQSKSLSKTDPILANVAGFAGIYGSPSKEDCFSNVSLNVYSIRDYPSCDLYRPDVIKVCGMLNNILCNANYYREMVQCCDVQTGVRVSGRLVCHHSWQCTGEDLNSGDWINGLQTASSIDMDQVDYDALYKKMKDNPVDKNECTIDILASIVMRFENTLGMMSLLGGLNSAEASTQEEVIRFFASPVYFHYKIERAVIYEKRCGNPNYITRKTGQPVNI